MQAQQSTQRIQPINRALSVTQPSAFLLAAGWKRVENRTWQTPYRGWLAIHAGSTDRDFTEEAEQELLDLNHPGLLADLNATGAETIFDADHFGAIIGAAFLADIVPLAEIEAAAGDGPIAPDSSDGDGDEIPLAVFATGPLCWIFDRAVYFGDKPIKCKGRLNVFEMPADIATEVSNRIIAAGAGRQRRATIGR